MKLRLSNHWHKHEAETWNAKTIRAAYEAGQMTDAQLIPGKTADVIYGYIDNECVGMIVTKENDGERVIITAYAAPPEYWHKV